MSEVSRILGVPHSALRGVTGAALLCGGLLLTACGQKGPLYLEPVTNAKPLPAVSASRTAAPSAPMPAATPGR